MGFPEENLLAAKSIISSRRIKAEAEAADRLSKAHEEIPGLQELDAQFPLIGREIIALFGAPDANERIEALREKSAALRKKREELLAKAGLDADHTSPSYFCKQCNDTGYVNFDMCDCMRKELIIMGFERSGLKNLLKKQSFDNFSLDYYTGEDRLTMEMNLRMAKNFARDFGEGSPNLLMMGGTGLGKTHLSTAICAAVIGGGHDVQYETSQNVIADFTHERFGRGYNDNSSSKTDRYFDCDLLVIDDFGAEETNQFTVSCFYNLINTRFNSGKPIIINTNLQPEAIAKRYTDRIASRLFGEFTVLSFNGKDVRMQKLMN
jgi:DNA replication protein DnaC